MSHFPRPRRSVIATAVLAIALTGPWLSPVAQASVSTATCAPVEVITVRGMGEPANSNGWVLGPIATAIQQGLTVGVKITPLPYSAPQDILAGTNEGVTMLTSRLNTSATRCPQTKIVVLGFSLGALVAGETFAPTTRYPGVVTTPLPTRVDPRIAAVILFGDGRFNSRGPEAAGTFWPGVDAPYARPATAFARFGDHVRNVCNATDGICQTLLPTQSTEQAHQDYVKYSGAVVSYVAGQISQMP